VVTGGSQGIGLAVATSLAEAGARVALSARTERTVAAAASELNERFPGRVEGIVADVANYMECERLVAETVARFGSLDILINNAGAAQFLSIEQMSYQQWRSQIDVNLAGVWSCTKAALPHLTDAGSRGEGWVINIGSLASRHPMAGGTGYNAAKFGVLGMTEAMMLDLRRLGIRVSIVMPGSVNTDFGGTPAQAEDTWKLQPADCARAVMHLLGYPREAHLSRIEMRPAIPPSRG
jgi:NAD(P)-dependent dehydrogenase (short-subunit alcohol dehydrogenase family)